MDSVGSLELSWAQGYNGGKIGYIDKDVICYQAGSNVKFVSEDGTETVYNFKGNGVGPFAVHPTNKCFAIAEQSLNPKITVFMYPTFREVAVLKDGSKLEYRSMIFSHSEYLGTISGVPEFQLILWRYTDGTKLATVDLVSDPVTCLTFNPGNWRQICVTTENSMTIWNTEQSDNKYVLLPQKVKLPAENPSLNFDDEKDRDIPTRASTRMSRYTVDLPKAAIAGLVGEKAEVLEEIQDTTPRVVPLSHAWSPSGDVFVGCKGGQILRVDGEIYKAKILYCPLPPASAPNSRATSATSRYNSQMDLPTADEVKEMIFEGGADCVSLHRKGLYVAGQDGMLRLVDLKSEEFKILEKIPIGNSVTALSFSSNYKRIAVATSKGTFHVYEVGAAPDSVKNLKDFHMGNFVGISCLAGNEYCVSVREDGELQVWTIDKGLLISSVSVGIQALCLACCPMVHVAAVGTVSGHVFYVDLTFPKKPRVVTAKRLYQGPLTHLTYDSEGKYLVSGSDDGHVFVIDGRASVNFKPIGYTTIPGDIQSISTHSTNTVTKIVVTSNTSKNKRNGADTVLSFRVTDELVKDLRNNVNSLKYDFKDASIKRIILKLPIPGYGAALAEENSFFTLGQTSKKLYQFSLPEEPPKKSDDVILEVDEDELVDSETLYQQRGKPNELFPEAEFDSHQLPGGKLQLSPHGKWLASCGTDGAVQLRALGTLDRFVTVKPHDYHLGGVRIVAFADDAQNIFTTGYDGVLCCYSWKFSSTGVGKAKSAMEAARARKTRLMQIQKDEDEVVRNFPEYSPPSNSRPVSGEITQAEKERRALEKAQESDEIYRTPTPVAPKDATWQQVQEFESIKEEDNEYASVKQDLRVQIRDMRRTIQGMLKQNEVLPDIEKLGRHEFDLDIEEQNRLQAEADAEVNRVKEEIEFENLAKIYLREMIKRECWDEMDVKGRAIQSFFTSLEVSNFPMRKRSAATEKQLQIVSTRRKIQLADVAARKAELEASQKPGATPARESYRRDDEAADVDEGDESGKEKPSTTGSLGAMYGGGSDLFFSQFDLHTRDQKVSQIVLLEDAIYRIKNTFNKEFDEVYQKKLSEISKIKDKNKRIVKILADLDLIEDVVQPVLSIYEDPESLLTVEDHEVKVEKYLTAEQRKELEKKEKEEEERKMREKGDNARERGLDMMMGGVLEIKKEDELKKDIPKPLFMSTKEPNDWTEDEQKLAKEYEKRVKELQEEREKYRKQLETELRKLQSMIHDSMQGFDDTLTQLFMKKIKIMMVIYQEELKILRLRYSLLVEEELETREKELNRLMEHKKTMKALTATALMESKKHMDAFKEQYDILNAEDKVMDKAFKREFHDVTAVQQDQLYRLFRKRPRIPRLKGFDTPAPSTADTSIPNPFADRPSTARQHAQAKSQLDAAIQDLDKISNIPEGVEEAVWQRLCAYRREKIENDLLIKQKALILAEMDNFYKKRVEEDERLKNDMEGIFDTLNKLHDDRIRFNLNLEVQLMLKQGQVEVDPTNFIHDYKDSALIHRGVVEELNSNIKQLGESKITSMMESKDFRKGIIQLEWEQKRMLMQMEDLKNKMKDIQFMKVTREIQLYLSNEDYDGKKSEEIGKLEQTILTQLKHHEKNVREKKRIIKDLGKTIKSRDSENFSMDNDLAELNVTVNERRHIDDVNAERRSDTGTEKRYQEIVQRRKLVDLAKAQAQEVAVLRAEVERLRMRTFPALVQVEH
ncbi:cilia- and flagella-associated protein 43-like isoform X3 [Ostrea edulis]|uniref:cilia- and flagella-associated protein 43-like isoform X3 n=1 Tax=Ostrea edulis TaxID=37623 RepID=UPI0024AEFB81|nr:cilia- and flagella-associated protein 43-like isoform X3 [Ostrea edulis]